jgi:hypothetical protein
MIYSLREHDGKTELTFTQEDPREQPESHSDGEDEGINPILAGLKQLVEEPK